MFFQFRTSALLIILQFWSLQTSILFAQNLQCHFNESISNNPSQSQLSSGGGAGSNVVCNDFMEYIPQNDAGIKIMKVNIHVMQYSASDPQNFPDNPSARATIATLIGPINGNEGINYLFRNVALPLNGGVQTGAYIPNTKIQFKLMDIYYHVDPAGINNNGNNCGTYNFTNYGINTDSELNIFLGQGFGGGGCSHFPFNQDGLYVNYFGLATDYLVQPFNQFQVWDAGLQLLGHEIGHSLGYYHTFQPDQFSDTPSPGGVAFCDANTVNGCTNNLMSYSNTKTWISPQQVGYGHYTLINYSRNFLTTCDYDPNNSTIINNTQIWTKGEAIQGDIIVNPGASLTIKCNVYMSNFSKIIVKQGGLLVVDGGYITTECSNLWSGIQVWGTNNKAQYELDSQGNYYQGRVEVRNGAIIENAEIAIQAWQPGSWTGGGGIIKTLDATIRNCWKGIHYGYYTNYNSASYSRNSTFETTADLINGDVPQTFIEGWAFKGVKVNGCTFRNTNPNASDINQLGRGIYLESAKGIITGLTTATVTDFCDETNTNWQPNIFENLYKGVELVNYGMQQTNGIFTSTVTRNYFKNCVYGVECKGMPAVSINQNKILLGANSVYNTYNEGITHKSYTGFSISENCVSQVGTNAAYTGGIIITEVGGDNNQVYRNFSFDNEHAYLSNGKNRTASPTNQKFKGLQFLCNQNYGAQQYDIAVEGDGLMPPNPMNGIRYYQGGSGNSLNPSAAGNLFTHYCPTAESDFFNATNNPIVYFHSNTAVESPLCYSGLVTPSSNTTVVTNACITKFGPHQMGGILTSSQKSLLLADYAVKNSQYLAVALLYNNIIDNGNTQNLLQSISTSLPTNATDLKNLMISNSPNLSDRVVQDLVKESTILQNSDLLSIIAANPDVAHNEELLSMLQEKTNPMDEWMIEFLREAGTYETNRTLLEQTFAQKQYDREEIAWEMVRHLLSDTITDSINHTELHQWLNIIGSPRAKYMIADDYASMGEFSAASAVLNNINERNLDRYEIMELQGIKSWLLLQNTLFNEGRNIYELSSAELESIRPYAENERMYGLAGTFAANVLNHYERESYVLPTIYPENNRSSNNNDAQTKKKRTLKKLVQNVLVSKSDLTVYPNPVNNQLSIDLTNVEQASILSIYSLKGDLILTQSVQNDKLIKLNTSGLANGSYTLEVIDYKGNSIKSEKIIVNHN